MSAQSPALVRSWSVGDRVCRMVVSRPAKGEVACAVCEWTPDVPTNLSAEEWRQYRAGRDSVAAELAAQLGGAAAVIEL